MKSGEETQTFDINGDLLPLWPSDSGFHNVDLGIYRTTFGDADLINKGLRQYAVKMLQEAGKAAMPDAQSMGGPKIHHVDHWNCPEARLISARAREMFRRVVKSEEAHADLSWCNFYRRNDFIMPHAHRRATAGVVYLLDEGDPVPGDPLSGRLCFPDPRLPKTCKYRKGFMSSPIFPQLAEGTMIIFPGQTVHMVTPYYGDRHRITLSWNMNPMPLDTDDSEGRLRAGIPNVPPS